MNIPVECSRESILRFITLFLSLRDTVFWYHQTLTFGTQQEDFRDAKPCLRRLFDSVQVELAKRYQVAIIYLMGRQENRRVHFHVLFLFYGQLDESPEALRQKLWGIVWHRWQKQSPGTNARANQLNLRSKPDGLRYLLQHVCIASTGREKGKPLWWGVRNRALIASNSVQVSAEAVAKEFKDRFPRLFRVSFSILDRPKEQYGWRSLRAEKALARETGYGLRFSWEAYKSDEFKNATGASRPVSDRDFIQFRKEHGFLKQD